MTEEQKIYSNGEKITIYEDEQSKKGASIEFTYFRPSLDDAEMLYSLYQKMGVECASKCGANISALSSKGEENLTEEEKNLLQNYFQMIFVSMKVDKQSRVVWNDCLAKCLIDNALYPMAIQLPRNTPFMDKIRMLMLNSCVARFTTFTTPLAGE